MSLCFPSTSNNIWTNVALFLGGSSLFGGGLYLSYVHVAPQQARIKARNIYVRDRLKKKYGYDISLLLSQLKPKSSLYADEVRQSHNDVPLYLRLIKTGKKALFSLFETFM